MLFSIGNRIFEIRKSHIYLGVISLILIAGFFFLPWKEVPLWSFFLKYWVHMLIVFAFAVAIYSVIQFKVMDKILFEVRFREDLALIKEDNNQKKIPKGAILTIVVVILLIGGVFTIIHSNALNFSMDLNIKKFLIEKKPSLETPKPVETTTTTEKKTGFLFFNKKDDYDNPKDCTFDGRGHEAILMPSGNYYCRSTEKRIPIKIDGVEVICCVTP